MSNGSPFLYDEINTIDGLITPSTIHVQDAFLTAYFRKYLFQKAIAVFKWDLPETWDKDYFLYTLFGWGYLAILKTDLYGVIPQQCGLTGQNIFYKPTHALITNHLLTGILQPKIDIQCVVMKVQPNYSSIMDIVNMYAGLIALSIQTIIANTNNSQLSYVGFGSSKAEAETLKKMFDNILSGEPAVVIDKGLKDRNNGEQPWQLFTQNVGQNYIVGDILDNIRTFTNMFLTEIGVENANTDKKERLIVAEVNANNEETASMASMWLEEMQLGCSKVNKMFGVDISVDWRVKPKTEDPEPAKEDDE